jgi:hypothetical protein
VIENFDEFLVDEGILGYRVAEVGAFHTWQGKGHRFALARGVEGCPDFGITLGRTETHDYVVGLHQCFQPRLKGEGEIKSGKGAFAHNDRMYEFNRDVLRVGGVRSSSESQETATAKKSLGHFAAGLGQAAGFQREKRLEHLIARQQSLFDLRRQFETRRHRAS